MAIMATPSKLAHVVYMTRRFDEMISWYKTVFEARVQYENPAFAFAMIGAKLPRCTSPLFSAIELQLLNKLVANRVRAGFVCARC